MAGRAANTYADRYSPARFHSHTVSHQAIRRPAARLTFTFLSGVLNLPLTILIDNYLRRRNSDKTGDSMMDFPGTYQPQRPPRRGIGYGAAILFLLVGLIFGTIGGGVAGGLIAATILRQKTPTLTATTSATSSW